MRRGDKAARPKGVKMEGRVALDRNGRRPAFAVAAMCSQALRAYRRLLA